MTSTVEQKQAVIPDTAAEVEERMVIQSSALRGDGAPSRLLVAPWGEVRSVNGTFVLDEESARLVAEAFVAHGTDLPIDYEHQSLGGVYSSPTGQAPAAGWIQSLQAVGPTDGDKEEAGLFAEVAWTPSAREKIVAREYRYLSPVVIVRKRDRRVVALHSAALTNKPAIAGMKPIVNRQGPGVNLREAKDPCRENQEHEAGSDGTASVDDAVETLRLQLNLEECSGVETVLVAAKDRLSSLMREADERQARQRVETAMRSGKLTAAQQAWAESLALKDPASFDAWAASAPVVVRPGRLEAPAEHDGTGGRNGRAAVVASARAAFRAEPALAMLTSESAWVRDALREAGLEVE